MQGGAGSHEVRLEQHRAERLGEYGGCVRVTGEKSLLKEKGYKTVTF